MAKRPGTLCHLKLGGLVSSAKGFVATFNWLVDFCANLSGDDGVEVDAKDSDHPKIRVKKLYYS